LEGPVFQRELKKVAVEFSHNRDFLRYLDTLTRAKSNEGEAAFIWEPFYPSATQSAQGPTAARNRTNKPST
jgi:hypothetical protein